MGEMFEVNLEGLVEFGQVEKGVRAFWEEATALAEAKD